MHEPWRVRFVVGRPLAGLPWPRVAAEDEVGPAYHCHGNRRTSDDASVVQLGLAGHGEAVWQGRRWRIPPDHVLVTPVGDPAISYGHDGSSERWRFVFLAFLGANAAVQALRQRHGPVLPLGTGHPVGRLLLGLRRHTDGTRLQAGEAALLVTRLLAALADLGSTSAGTRLISDARSVITNEARTTTVSALARRLGVSREHLARVFQAELATSPKAWLQSERMEQVRRRLLASDEAVADIARDLGFGSVSRLCHGFAALHGNTPQRYRRSRRA